MKEIEKYFELNPRQREQLSMLPELYGYWNDRINVVSRKDIDSLMLKHVLHSLSLLKVCEFAPGTKIADVGCGGGFPTIPLAIMLPECRFTAIDSIGKKIKVVSEIAKSLSLENVEPMNCRVESLDMKFDFVIARAVTAMPQFVKLTWDRIRSGSSGSSLENGIVCLKGGDLTDELSGVGHKCVQWELSQWFDEEFFETKKVVYIKK
jgi:16S rRNA (guanine527-N7)-methyltransferase